MHSFTVVLALALLGCCSAFNLMNEQGKCLAAKDNQSTIDARLVIAPCKNEKGQEWRFDDKHRLCNDHGFCVAVPFNRNSDHYAVAWAPTTEEAQQWDLTAWGTLVNAWGRCLGTTNNANADNSEISTQSCDRAKNSQKWHPTIVV